MRKHILFGLLALALLSCGRQPADQVNVFNGTDFAGNTYPGAVVPFGAVQLSPDTDVNTTSGYHYRHDVILGFSHTHLSGTGCPDLGDFLVTPGLDVVEPLPFSHQDEQARPGYYKVSFAKGITAELTATPHAGAPAADHFAYLFFGYLDVPADGVWSFALRDDDGAALWVDGICVVDNDGIHEPAEAEGTIPLGKGLHYYKLMYFDDEGGQELAWSWKAPESDRYVPVPAKSLYFK